MGVSKTININNNTGSAISISRARVFLDDGSGSTLQLDTNNGNNFPNSITRSSSQIFFNAPNYGTSQVNVELLINYNFIPSLDDCAKIQTFNFVETSTTANDPIEVEPSPQQVLLILQANPTNGGTAIVGGLYNLNQFVKISASPRTGYQFSSWMEGGLNFSNQNPTTILMDKAKVITANFSTTNQVPDEGIPVEEQPVDNPLVKVKSLIVNANHSGTESSLNNKIEIKNSSGLTIQTATLNNSVNINNIAPNTQYSLNVLTDSDWNFKNWSGNNSSSINPLPITVLENFTFTANFEKKPTQTTTLRVTKLLGSTLNSIVGTISGFINEIDILNDTGSSEFNRTVDLNANLDLDASSNTDYEFVEWIDNNTGSSISSIRPLRIILTSTRNVSAVFKLIPKVSLSIEKLEGDGNIEVTGDLVYSLPVGTLSDNRNLSVGSVITFSISTPQGKEIDSILFNGVSQDVLATSITKTINSNSTLQVRYKDSIVLNPARVNLTITKYLFGSINGSSGNVFVENSSILNYSIGSSIGTNTTSIDFGTTSNVIIQPSLERTVNSVFINGNNTPILGGNGNEVVISVDMNEVKNIDIYFN